MGRSGTIDAFAGMAAQPSSRRAVDTWVTEPADAPVTTMQALKPYFVLACAAFMVGFVAYLAAFRTLNPPVEAQDGWQATISAPMPPVDAPLTRTKSI